jgi:hypothetical protein
MQPMRFFIDTHDKAHKSFPEGISREQFEGFFVAFEAACRAEGVVLVRVHAGLEDGKAFCLTMAPSAEAVKRAHEKAGLPFDTITEVETASPSDTFFARQAKAA